MALKKAYARIGWWVLVTLLVLAAIRHPVNASGPGGKVEPFVFTAHGDLGPYDSPGLLASLDSLANTGAVFSLGLGDLSYQSVGDEQQWCATIQQALGPTYPFEIVMGNHEDENKLNGYIGDFVRYCPDRMNAQGLYGAEYYFDYPAQTPLIRVIMIGADNSWDWDGSGEVSAGEEFDYDRTAPANQAHLTWLSNAIDSARESGVPWVVVGVHKNCLTMGEKSCEIGPEVLNLLVEKRVDLILQGHDHTYQRSKQLALGPGCAAIPVNAYGSACVADDGADGTFAKGAGTVIIISGHFGGRPLYDISPDDPEAGYFAKAMGQNGWIDLVQGGGMRRDVTHGFVEFEVSDTRMVVNHVSTNSPTTFADSFVIGAAEPPTGMTTVTPARTPTPTTAPDQTAVPSESYATVSLAPAADAYVSEDKPDAIYGRNKALRTDASPDMRSYLRFDMQQVNGTVLRARLRVYANTASSAGYEVRTVSAGGWEESALTYANAPDVGSAVALSGPFAAEVWTEIDVTALAAAAAGDGSPLELVLTTTGNTAASYSSREGANPPELVVDFVPALTTATPPPTNTQAATETLETRVLLPAADAYVHSDSADANYGASASLRMDASPEVRSYLRFDPAGLNTPVVRATLRLYALSASNAGIRVHLAADHEWGEGDLTFASAPAFGEESRSSGAIIAEAWTEIDVTAWVMGDSPLSFALTAAGSTAVKFSSRNGTHPPELIIEFSPPGTESMTSATPSASATPAASPTSRPTGATPMPSATPRPN